MPPSCTPGDGKSIRQGTSLLYRAGEKTKASAPRGLGKNPSSNRKDFFNEIRLRREILRLRSLRTAHFVARGYRPFFTENCPLDTFPSVSNPRMTLYAETNIEALRWA